jgi:hypothetical protein
MLTGLLESECFGFKVSESYQFMVLCVFTGSMMI